MKYLFVCSANKQRSRTAHDYFEELNPEDEFESAGTNHKICWKEGTTPLTEELMEWADKVYVMEKGHQRIIEKHTGNKFYSKITVLRITDQYKYGSKKLIEKLKDKLSDSDLTLE